MALEPSYVIHAFLEELTHTHMNIYISVFVGWYNKIQYFSIVLKVEVKKEMFILWNMYWKSFILGTKWSFLMFSETIQLWNSDFYGKFVLTKHCLTFRVNSHTCHVYLNLKTRLTKMVWTHALWLCWDLKE